MLYNSGIKCRDNGRSDLLAGLDILHLPDAGFVAGVETVGAVELGGDDFAFFEEPIE